MLQASVVLSRMAELQDGSCAAFDPALYIENATAASEAYSIGTTGPIAAQLAKLPPLWESISDLTGPANDPDQCLHNRADRLKVCWPVSFFYWLYTLRFLVAVS